MTLRGLRDRNDRGATIILLAISAVALFTIVAIVIDLGAVRAQKSQIPPYSCLVAANEFGRFQFDLFLYGRHTLTSAERRQSGSRLLKKSLREVGGSERLLL